MTHFVKGRHRDDKKEFIGYQVRCIDMFSVHVEKGQTLESEEAQSEKKLQSCGTGSKRNYIPVLHI